MEKLNAGFAKSGIKKGIKEQVVSVKEGKVVVILSPEQAGALGNLKVETLVREAFPTAEKVTLKDNHRVGCA